MNTNIKCLRTHATPLPSGTPGGKGLGDEGLDGEEPSTWSI